MKRFHVHLHVDELEKNIAFYTALFNQPPTRTEIDYAKWMLADPPVNFALSTRGQQAGLDHLGFQVDSDHELQELKDRARRADIAQLDAGESTCCYARSEKYWVTDPQGIAWEQFHTLDSIPVFSQRAATDTSSATCCAPRQASLSPTGDTIAQAPKSSCC